jgi:hypothetical protein
MAVVDLSAKKRKNGRLIAEKMQLAADTHACALKRFNAQARIPTDKGK